MKNLAILIFVFFVNIHLSAQEFYCPVDHSEAHEVHGSERNTEISPCFGCETRTKKTIQMVFHVIRDEFGGHNFQVADEPLLENIVAIANAKLGNNQFPTHPASPNQEVPDIKIEFELIDILYHDTQNWAYPNIDYPNLDPTYLDIFLVEQSGEWFGTGCDDPNYCNSVFCCAGGWAGGGLNYRAVLNRGYFRYVNQTILPHCIEAANGDFDEGWALHYADILIHEVGHLLTLAHVYTPIDDGCSDTPDDIQICSSNNFLDACSCDKGSFTCCQVHKMHDYMEAGNFSCVVEEDDCESDFSFIELPNCTYALINNSDPYGDGVLTETNWCVQDLQEEGAIEYFDSYHLLYTPPCNGYFQICLEITDLSGCSSTSCQVINVSCTNCTCRPGPDPCVIDPPIGVGAENGVGDPRTELNVFPNPVTSTSMTLSFDEVGVDERYTIQLFDLRGMMVKVVKTNLGEQVISLNVADLNNGMYMIKAQSNKGAQIVKQFLVQH